MELSVVIPVLNEATVLPALFRTLAAQTGVAMEVILCDGGSTDGTVELADRLAGEMSFPVRVTTSSAGRGQQLNAGARHATGTYLLFLHADSLFPDPCAFRKGVDLLAGATAQGETRVAGHFPLRFLRQDTVPSRGYHHFECKARLDRPGCTHGDQGFLLPRELFRAVGPFDETAPMLAETRLADTVRTSGGRWLLIPAEIHTSARRFETEGLRERQTLNAIITNFAAAGWAPFFREIPLLYGNHDSTGRLDLPPLLRHIDRLMTLLPLPERLRLWRATGRYVRDNAWQLALAWDTGRSFRRGLPPGPGETPTLSFYDRHLDRLTDHPPGRAAAACLVWLWLRWNCR